MAFGSKHGADGSAQPNSIADGARLDSLYEPKILIF
jgi:hypothetical protein